MKDTLIQLDTAKKAKEKGFDWETLGAWVDLTEFKGQITLEEFLRRNNHNKKGHRYSAPTQSLLAKWLRDVHNIHISIDFDLYDGAYDYGVYFIDSTNRPCHFSLEHRITFEDAMEAALLYALDLIS